MKKIILVLIIMLCVSCTFPETSSERLHNGTIKCNVELLNGDGTIAKTWTTNGGVLNRPYSDTFVFIDKKTNLQVMIHGTVIITTVDNGVNNELRQ